MPKPCTHVEKSQAPSSHKFRSKKPVHMPSELVDPIIAVLVRMDDALFRLFAPKSITKEERGPALGWSVRVLVSLKSLPETQPTMRNASVPKALDAP